MRIAVIAGHSTDDPGAVKDDQIPPITEHEVVQEITLYLIDRLDEASIGWVSLNGTLKEKVKACNKLGVDLALEIHLNAAPLAGTGYGTECLVYRQTNYLATDNLKVYNLANDITRNLRELGLAWRKVKERKDLYFLRKTRMPAVIVECFFLDNETEAAEFVTQTEQIAGAIFDAVKEWQA